MDRIGESTESNRELGTGSTVTFRPGCKRDWQHMRMRRRWVALLIRRSDLTSGYAASQRAKATISVRVPKRRGWICST